MRCHLHGLVTSYPETCLNTSRLVPQMIYGRFHKLQIRCSLDFVFNDTDLWKALHVQGAINTSRTWSPLSFLPTASSLFQGQTQFYLLDDESPTAGTLTPDPVCLWSADRPFRGSLKSSNLGPAICAVFDQTPQSLLMYAATCREKIQGNLPDLPPTIVAFGQWWYDCITCIGILWSSQKLYDAGL